MSRPAPLAPVLLDSGTEGAIDLVALFRRCSAGDANVFWLDSGPSAVEGWSILGTGYEDPLGPSDVRIDNADPSDPGLPPFCGGWVGWVDYEGSLGASGAGPAERSAGAAWLRVTQAIALDHATGRAWHLAATDGDARRDSDDDSDSAPPAQQHPERGPTAHEAPEHSPRARGRHTAAEYQRLVDECRARIREGRADVVCLTTRFDVPAPADAVAAYLRLRDQTPAHHGGFLRIGDRALLSASPEQFLLSEAGTVITRPIKGTRPRGDDPVSDAALAAELRDSTKERAENRRVVDLVCADLDRVCVVGSVHVDALCEVESYPAVHQLVSTVRGRLKEPTTLRELLASTFPAASMTGAPKLAALELLQGFEGAAPRGVYSGCFGYVAAGGRVDLGMVIRSIVVEGDRAYIGAGGGITAASDPAAETAEVATKARAPLRALGADLPASWRALDPIS